MVFYLLQGVRTASLPYPPSCWIVTGVPCLGVKRLVREFDHSPPCNDKVKYEWSYRPNFTPALFFLDVDRDNIYVFSSNECPSSGFKNFVSAVSVLLWRCFVENSSHTHVILLVLPLSHIFPTAFSCYLFEMGVELFHIILELGSSHSLRHCYLYAIPYVPISYIFFFCWIILLSLYLL